MTRKAFQENLILRDNTLFQVYFKIEILHKMMIFVGVAVIIMLTFQSFNGITTQQSQIWCNVDS